ncbi:hypothetical protein ACKKBF_B21560 [Auxenochlorella protothecoides x Auxenochlorella symbiontica]
MLTGLEDVEDVLLQLVAGADP